MLCHPFSVALLHAIRQRITLVAILLVIPSLGCKTEPETEIPECRWFDFSVASPSLSRVDPTHRLIVAETMSETIVYELASGKRLHGWADGTRVASFSPDGQFLATVRKGEVVVLDAESFEELQRFPMEREHWRARSPWPNVALTGDAKLIAIANDFQKFRRQLPPAVLLYSRNGHLQQSFQLPERAKINQVSFVSDDRLLVKYSHPVSGRYRTDFMLCGTASGEVLRRFEDEETVRASADGRWLVSAVLAYDRDTPRKDHDSTAKKLAIWDAHSGDAVSTILVATTLRDFVISPNSQRILAPVADRLTEWSISTGEVIYRGDPSEEPYSGVAYSADGRRRFATTERPSGLDDDMDHYLHGWDIESEKDLGIGGYKVSQGCRDLVFYSNGDRFVDLAGGDPVRDVRTGDSILALPKYRLPVGEVAFAGTGEHFLVGSRLTEGSTGKQRTWHLPAANHEFIAGGRLVFSGDHVGIFLTDVASGRTIWKLLFDSLYRPSDVAVSNDARHIVVAYRFGDFDSDTRLVIVQTAKPNVPLIIDQYASAVAVHPEGDRFIAASHELIEERDIHSGEHFRTLWRPPGKVQFVTYSPDGSKVLAGGAIDHTDPDDWIDADDQGWAVLLDAATGKAEILPGHQAPVTSGAFSGDGHRAVTGCLDKIIRLWDAETGNEIHVFRGHLGSVHRVAYSPDDDRILSAGQDGAAIWNIAGVVDPLAKPARLAASFKEIGWVNAYNGRRSGEDLIVQTRQGFPGTGSPDARAEWTLIEVGNARRTATSAFPANWLRRAGSIRRVGDNTGPVNETDRWRYELCGESRDRDRKLLYNSLNDDRLIVVDRHDQIVTTIPIRLTHREAAISASGHEVAIARDVPAATKSIRDGQCEVTFYDAETGKEKRRFGGISSWYAHSLKMDPKQETLLLQINNNSLDLRDFHTGKQLARVENSPAGAGLQSDYSVDGKYVVTCKYPAPDIYLHDPKTLDVVKTLKGHLPVRWFRLTPDGKQLLAGEQFEEQIDLVAVWDLESGRRLWARSGPSSAEGRFSSDGRFYLTKGGSGLWTLWDLQGRKIRCVVTIEDDLAYNHPCFGPDDRSLHLGAPNGRQLWTLDDEQTETLIDDAKN